MRDREKTEDIDEEKLQQIVDRIEEFLVEDGKAGWKVDNFYQELILEFMRVNKKAKSEYNEEEDTTISLKGKNISIKPVLPDKNKKIAKKYTRQNEDIAYKTMKLAQLVNRFAHMTENEELKDDLFSLKSDLIESVLDFAKNNPKINIKKRFDDDKMAMAVILEIPGYNMIALHVMKNRNEALLNKVNQLQESNDMILHTSTIMMPGVNREVLSTMKNMSIQERIQALVDLDANTFYKLAIRMGYNTDSISSQKDRKSFIETMISDKKINELLRENDDLEK